MNFRIYKHKKLSIDYRCLVRTVLETANQKQILDGQNVVTLFSSEDTWSLLLGQRQLQLQEGRGSQRDAGSSLLPESAAQ